ncbi:hypothetical protein SAMD00023353_2401200 [Rosellinia necatrix]|uniref:Uncharacterized protein n=1 Tax=Rosellinia necatrix TaxID=77044 RepID=A0A1W2TFW3_ROSNE|nr:hypothetical protein SAMD00023353_2401200 [Rosellinia necatrix]
MSQGYEAIPLARILNPDNIPLSQILNPIEDRPVAQAVNANNAIPISQILNPSVEEEGRPRVAVSEPEVEAHGEEQLTSDDSEQGDSNESGDGDSGGDDGEGEFVVVGKPASEPETSLARYLVAQIVQGLQSDVVAPRAEFWRTLDEALSPLQMADMLWDRSRCSDDPKPVRWVNRFYASCMRQVLRRRGHIPFNSNRECEDPQKQSKDRYAAATDIINIAADRFGDKVYAGLAIRSVALSKLFSVRQDRHAVVGSLLATELSSIIALPSKTIRNPAAVITMLWKEKYTSICGELKLHILSKGSTSSGGFDDLMDLADWEKPTHPTISEGLKERITGVAVGDLSHKKRYCPDEDELYRTKPSPRVYMICRWNRALKALAMEIEDELCQTVKKSFKEPLRWRSTLMLIERGSMRRDTRACVNWIIPLKIKGSNVEAKVQFDTGLGTKADVKDWLSLRLVTIQGDTCIRRVDDPLAFIWVRWYQRQHWNWLDQYSVEEEVDRDKAGPQERA